MATYIVLTNFTDQGIRNVKESTKPKRSGRRSRSGKKVLALP